MVWAALYDAMLCGESFVQKMQENQATSEALTASQLETIINDKMKAVIASEQAEKLVGKGRPYPYPAEYDQVPYPKGYSV